MPCHTSQKLSVASHPTQSKNQTLHNQPPPLREPNGGSLLCSLVSIHSDSRFSSKTAGRVPFQNNVPQGPSRHTPSSPSGLGTCPECHLLREALPDHHKLQNPPSPQYFILFLQSTCNRLTYQMSYLFLVRLSHHNVSFIKVLMLVLFYTVFPGPKIPAT